MGDPLRFTALADYIYEYFNTSTSIADIAGSKGKLQVALRNRNFNKVETYDLEGFPSCSGLKITKELYRVSNPKSYDLLVGLHPDEATDHIILGALYKRIPFVIVPCCKMPNAVPKLNKRISWVDHLILLAERGSFKVSTTELPIRGKNLLLHGEPKCM